jgi:site-specific DNA recombinase
VLLPESTVPPLVDEADFASAQRRLAYNRERSVRNTKNPEDALLRGGYVRCGYCGQAMRVKQPAGKRKVSVYACNRGSTLPGLCKLHGISVPLLDEAVWTRLSKAIMEPDSIREAVSRAEAEDHTGAQLEAVERTLAKLVRHQNNLVANLADLDPDSAEAVRRQLAATSKQLKVVEVERDALLAAQERAVDHQVRLASLEEYRQRVAANLAEFTWQNKRLALDAYEVQVFVWDARHTPRWQIEATPQLPEDRATVYSTTACSTRGTRRPRPRSRRADRDAARSRPIAP